MKYEQSRQTNDIVTHVELIQYGSALPVPILYDAPGYYGLFLTCIRLSHLASQKVLFIFLVSKTCLVPSPPRTFPIEEPIIGTSSFHFKMILRAVSLSASYDPWGESMTLMFRKVELYLLFSTRCTYVSYVSRGGSLYNLVESLESSYALKALFLFEPLIASPSPIHPFSWPFLLLLFVGSRKLLQVPRGEKPILIAPFGTLDSIVLCDGHLVFLAPLSTRELVDLSLSSSKIPLSKYLWVLPQLRAFGRTHETFSLRSGTRSMALWDVLRIVA